MINSKLTRVSHRLRDMASFLLKRTFFTFRPFNPKFPGIKSLKFCKSIGLRHSANYSCIFSLRLNA